MFWYVLIAALVILGCWFVYSKIWNSNKECEERNTVKESEEKIKTSENMDSNQNGIIKNTEDIKLEKIQYAMKHKDELWERDYPILCVYFYRACKEQKFTDTRKKAVCENIQMLFNDMCRKQIFMSDCLNWTFKNCNEGRDFVNQKLKELNPVEIYKNGKKYLPQREKTLEVMEKIKKYEECVLPFVNLGSEGKNRAFIKRKTDALTRDINDLKYKIEIIDREAVNSIISTAELSAKMSMSSMEKERDWATAGGIASAIGGPVAGIATALDVQAKNSEIRERNERRRNYYTNLSSNLSSSMIRGKIEKKLQYKRLIESDEKDIEKWKEFSEECKSKKIDGASPEEVIKRMIFDVMYVKQINSCFYELKVNLKTRPWQLSVKGGGAGAIDGSIIVDVYQHNEIIGRSYLLCPKYGFTKVANLVTIARGHFDENAPYEVKFTPNKLWLVEKNSRSVSEYDYDEDYSIFCDDIFHREFAIVYDGIISKKASKEDLRTVTYLVCQYKINEAIDYLVNNTDFEYYEISDYVYKVSDLYSEYV